LPPIPLILINKRQRERAKKEKKPKAEKKAKKPEAKEEEEKTEYLYFFKMLFLTKPDIKAEQGQADNAASDINKRFVSAIDIRKHWPSHVHILGDFKRKSQKRQDIH
jgi:hypothetical protein